MTKETRQAVVVGIVILNVGLLALVAGFYHKHVLAEYYWLRYQYTDNKDLQGLAKRHIEELFGKPVAIASLTRGKATEEWSYKKNTIKRSITFRNGIVTEANRREVIGISISEVSSDGSSFRLYVDHEYFMCNSHSGKSSPGGYSTQGKSSVELLGKLSDKLLALYTAAGQDYVLGPLVNRGKCFTVEFKHGKSIEFLLKDGWYEDEKLKRLYGEFHNALWEYIKRIRDSESEK